MRKIERRAYEVAYLEYRRSGEAKGISVANFRDWKAFRAIYVDPDEVCAPSTDVMTGERE